MTDRFRVAMVAACPFPCPRGTPVRIRRLAGALGRRGHEVHVVTYHLGDTVADADFTVHRIPRVPTYRREAPGPTYQKLLLLDALLVFKLRQVMRERRFDIIHAHHFEGLIAALLTRRRDRPPVIFDAHTLLESELPYYRLGLPGAAKRWLARNLDRRLPQRATAIVAVSEQIRDKLVRSQRVAPEMITVIPGGVELDLFKPEAETRPSGETRPKTLIYAGSLAAYQGIELMLEAFAEVRRSRSDVRLLLATDSSFAPYERAARRLGIREQIDTVPGDVASLRAHLARADLALNPRTNCDGYPQKVLNYMAAAKPIVSFAGSARNLEHGEVAWLVRDGDVSGLAAAIVRLLDDPEFGRRLGRNARRQVKRERSWTRAAEATERLYAAVVQRSRSRDSGERAHRSVIDRARIRSDAER